MPETPWDPPIAAILKLTQRGCRGRYERCVSFCGMVTDYESMWRGTADLDPDRDLYSYLSYLVPPERAEPSKREAVQASMRTGK